ncbi:MAG: alpha/beta hydrolase-fold protein [Acidobacteriota bacterium]|nr:alpha/beta hydrolase-fold protein [Acidobacteriota bacterium]
MLAIGGLGGCAHSAPRDPIPPHRSFDLTSEVVDEVRRIAVYTPPGYESGEADYPVLYMPDGGVAEDFPHIANTIDALIRDGAIAPVLVVGIENTDRRRDLTPASTTEDDLQYAPGDDGAAAFRSFIETELIPEIDRRYRTTEERALVGESFAGLFVMDTFFRRRQLFQRYIAMDPSLWWDDHALVRKAEERLPDLAGGERTLWFTGSDAEDIVRHTDALAEILETQAPSSLRWTYDPRPEEQHWTIFRATKEDAFRWALWPAEGE